MYTLTQNNRNVLAVLAAFLLVLSAVAYMACSSVSSLRGGFQKHRTNTALVQELYTNAPNG